MYQRAPAAFTYFEAMGPDDLLRQASRLRTVAEQYLLLANGTDQATHDSLVIYASDFLDEAQEIEGTIAADEASTPDPPPSGFNPTRLPA